MNHNHVLPFALLMLPFIPSVSAQSAADERLSRECGAIYAKLCADIPEGNDRLLLCQDKHSNLAVPPKCQADYQSAIEGIMDSKGAVCITAAKPFCRKISTEQPASDFFQACKKKNPAVFKSVSVECGKLFNN